MTSVYVWRREESSHTVMNKIISYEYFCKGTIYTREVLWPIFTEVKQCCKNNMGGGVSCFTWRDAVKNLLVKDAWKLLEKPKQRCWVCAFGDFFFFFLNTDRCVPGGDTPPLFVFGIHTLEGERRVRSHVCLTFVPRRVTPTPLPHPPTLLPGSDRLGRSLLTWWSTAPLRRPPALLGDWGTPSQSLNQEPGTKERGEGSHLHVQCSVNVSTAGWNHLTQCKNIKLF